MTHYSVEAVIKGVGWLKPLEKQAIRDALGPRTCVDFEPVIKQLHLGWTCDADSTPEAARLGLTMYDSAKNATGIYVPHTTLFCVREMDTS